MKVERDISAVWVRENSFNETSLNNDSIRCQSFMIRPSADYNLSPLRSNRSNLFGI